MQARLHRRHHLRQSADRDSAAGRQHVGPPARAGAVDRLAAKSADRARHRQSSLAETLRPRHRRHAREFRQDGRAADPSGTARLAGRGVHEPRLEHQADQQADDDVGGVPDGVGVRATPPTRQIDLENRYLWRFRPQRLEAEIVRDSMLVAGGNINLAIGGEPIFPFIPADILVGQYPREVGEHARGPGGVAAWRLRLSPAVAAVPDVRYVRSSRHECHGRREERLDRADAGADAAEQSVRAVAGRNASRIAWRASASDPDAQVELAYRIALARPATDGRSARSAST